MKIKKLLMRILGIAVLFILMKPALGFSDEINLKDLFAGKIAPLTVKLKDLNSNWGRFFLTDENGASVIGKMYGGNSAIIVYTKGDTVIFGNEPYLITYRPPSAKNPFLALLQQQKDDESTVAPKEITPDTELSLSLLKIKSIVSLNNIKPFSLEQEILSLKEEGALGKRAKDSMARATKRSQATTALNELRMLDAALDQYAIENNKTKNSSVDWKDLTPYLKANSKIQNSGGKDSLGNPIRFGPTIGDGVRVSPATKETLSESTGGDTFWGAYS